MHSFTTLIANIKLFSKIIFILTILFSCKETTPDETISDESAYISEVFEYVYAPGQHSKKAFPSDINNIVGKPSIDKFIYLGGFGGYVVAGFNHNITNGIGFDFEVFALAGASPEPAVVYVMSDDNGDGKPNETWYELKGNQFENSSRNYWVKYYKADTTKIVPEKRNITWIDSQNNTGELICGYGAINSSDWWWPSTTTDSIVLSGTRLPNAYDNNSTDQAVLWTVPRGRFTEGYAENMHGIDFDNELVGNKLDISNAVNNKGNAVNITAIRFLKIQTGVFQQAGWTNEVSSEIRGAMDLR